MLWIDRYLRTLKSYVCNKSCPNGYIVEGYIEKNMKPFVQDICMMLKQNMIVKKLIMSLQIT